MNFAGEESNDLLGFEQYEKVERSQVKLKHGSRRGDDDSSFTENETPPEAHDFGDLGAFSLESFREELDNITKSLDDEIDFDKLLQEARSVSRSSHDEQRSPAPTLGTTTPSTPRTPAADCNTGVDTSEPTPVKTPGYRSFEYDENGDFLSTVMEDDSDDDDVGSEMALIDRLDRQAERIRRLENENRSLREEVRDLRNPGSRNKMKSPGATFADELLQVVDLPGDQYENLSRIMDLYFDRERSDRKVRRSRFY